MMTGPLVGGERGISDGCAVVGGIAVLIGTQWLLGKLLPESIASTIAWAALVAFGVAVWKFNRRLRGNTLLGSAAFGSRADVRGLETNGGDLLIGRSAKSGKLLRYDGPAHLLTMAPTRSGKGVGTLMPLPPRCPELNPVENVWQFMRDNWLSNRIFQSYDDIVDHCCFAWNKLVEQPWSTMSLGLRQWAHGY